MSMDSYQKIRAMGKQVKEKRKNESVDYEFMTAPCGLPCFECYLYLARFDRELAETLAGVFNASPEQIICSGCRSVDGKVAHLSMACRVYECTSKARIPTCADCDDFPCEKLHPYSDQAMKPHNTKVYNLCLIKKLGLEKWAREEAGDILDKYYYGSWTL